MPEPVHPSRRSFVRSAAAFAAAPLLGAPSLSAGIEPAPEVRKIRLVHTPAVCLSPQYLAADLLRLEGFDQVEYVEHAEGNPSVVVAEGRADLTMDTASVVVAALDAGKRILPLAGIHAGCYELIGNDRIRAVRDIKGRTVAVSAPGAGDHLFLSVIAAYVGLDPRKDIRWLAARSFSGARDAFAGGKADAFLGFAPEPQELRARGIGKVVLDTTEDRPWSQYFCCLVNANRDFAARHPVATRRALRAFLKAADRCAAEPERAARFLADKGFESRYELSVKVLKSLPFGRWREADPEDSLRFHALRLHEAGMIRTPPHKLIANGTDWRLLEGLKRELKA